jgi:CRISPR-associated endonuclease/helicase Cas3
MTLEVQDFPDYFHEVHGHPPFGWQIRLLKHVLAHGWTMPVSLPTASGKTAILDIALFALALQARASADERRTPRRICLVVDRRIVVDDAYRRACRIVAALRSPAAQVLRNMAAELEFLGGESPVDAALLRGGIYHEDRWARTPLQPVLMCSTVDQVGSRLLHRGYGLSPRTWPIHAGLLGHDTLVILDEAHCAKPFLQTLEAIGELRGKATQPLPGPWAAVPMSATLRSKHQPFCLDPTERADPVLGRRLQARKRTKLRTAARKGDEGLAAEMLKAVTTDAVRYASPGGTTLIVVNRVRAARLIFEGLRKWANSKAGEANAEVLLLTGRSRPAERDALLEAYRHRLMAGRSRLTGEAKPLLVVATQCIEVGADFDVDALLTEACPLDSLRQRFGRLDRLGDLGTTEALIVCRPELTGDTQAATLPKAVDPIYGAALTRTWWWLQKLAASNDELDFGVDALEERLTRDAPDTGLETDMPGAPFIFAEYCDLWAQTGPEPAVSPDPAIFLHGPRSGPPEVGVVWRSDLDPRAPETWAATVGAMPPVAGEVLPIPLYVARSWLLGTEADPGADIEGLPPTEEVDDASAAEQRRALDWRGTEASLLVSAAELRPGSTLVVPCAWGGADALGWTGRWQDIPEDIAESARAAARRTAVLRLHTARPLLPGGNEGQPPSWRLFAALNTDGPDGFTGGAELRDAIGEQLVEWARLPTPVPLAATLAALVADGRRIRVYPHPGGTGLIVAGYHRLADLARDFSDEDDLSSLATQGAIGLSDHLEDVRAHAERNARGAGLPPDLIQALACAGHLHDLGKADPRFHAWLVGGDWRLVEADRPLAKSDRVRTGMASELARRRAGYPPGARHELLSVRLAESQPSLLPDSPALRDLALHLIESHHGHCRPWAPVVADPRPISVRYRHEGLDLSGSSATGLERIDSGVSTRFWDLLRRYGWWGLSYLEACLRLADHRASERPGVDLPEDVV